MPRDRKRATRELTLLADVVLARLRAEAHAERHQIDDDLPNAPGLDSLSSAQSRRLPVEVH